MRSRGPQPDHSEADALVTSIKGPGQAVANLFDEHVLKGQGQWTDGSRIVLSYRV